MAEVLRAADGHPPAATIFPGLPTAAPLGLFRA
jgi:hypothetical protein